MGIRSKESYGEVRRQELSPAEPSRFTLSSWIEVALTGIDVGIFVVAVVTQVYSVHASTEEAPRGCTAVLRCTAPSFVRDLVRVVSWLQEPNYPIYPSLQGGKSKRYGSSPRNRALAPSLVFIFFSVMLFFYSSFFVEVIYVIKTQSVPVHVFLVNYHRFPKGDFASGGHSIPPKTTSANAASASP